MPIPALPNCPGGRLTYPFATTAGVAIVKNQLVAFGADDDTITGTTIADGILPIGVALADVLAADAGPTKRIEVLLLQPGTIIPMIVGAAVTRGSIVSVQGTNGRIKDAPTTPDPRSLIGRALGASSSAGDLLPVMVGGLATNTGA